MNVADHLAGNIALQHLHLVIQSHSASDSSTDLHQELQSPLPPSLTRVTIQARTLPSLHPAALKVITLHYTQQLSFKNELSLQHLSSLDLKLHFISDHVNLERDFFLNLGNVRNLSLDISGHITSLPNTTTADLANPATKYTVGVPNSVFLEDLKLGEKALPCHCSNIG